MKKLIFVFFSLFIASYAFGGTLWLDGVEQGTGSGGSSTAAGTSADTTNFDSALGATEDTVQKALDKLDDAAGGITNLSESASTETTVTVASSTGTNATLAAATAVRAGVMSKAKFDEVETNNGKNTNASTTLSVGTVGVETVAITSDGGADDVTLPAATNAAAGLMTKAKFDEVVVNNGKVTNTDDQTAAEVVNTPAGNIAAISVQDAITELDDEKKAIAITQTASLGDDGALTPTVGAMINIALTCTADDADIVMTEGGSEIHNSIVFIVNVAANTARFADNGGVVELSSPVILEQFESLTLQYITDRWVEIARGTSALAFATITTTETEYLPISYMIDGATAPDALETITSGTDKINVRTFAGDTGDEDVLFTWQVPLDCDVTSGIKFRIINFVTVATGPSTETWQFEMQGFSLGDGDALDGTLGTAQTSNSGSRTDVQYDRVATAWSGAMTSTHITGLAVGETVTFKLYRDYDDTDTYEQLIGVAGIELKYKRDHDATF